MKTTIITVCFNSAKTILHTLESVANQINVDIEYIIIDGGSTDNTLEIIEKYGQKITHLISEPDNGIYDALNKGIAKATGDIIGILHSDDVYSNNDVLESAVAEFNDPTVDAAYGDAAFFKPNRPNKIIRKYRSDRFNPNKLAWGWMPAHTAVFFRRRVYERYGLYKTNYVIGSDFDFIARVFYRNKITYRYIPKTLVYMQAGGVSNKNWRSNVLLNKEVLRSCRENGIKTNFLKILSKYPLKILEYT